jgi:hypothetical protein
MLEKPKGFVDSPLILAKSCQRPAKDDSFLEDEGLVSQGVRGAAEDVFRDLQSAEAPLGVCEEARNEGIHPLPASGARLEAQNRSRQLSQVAGHRRVDAALGLGEQNLGHLGSPEASLGLDGFQASLGRQPEEPVDQLACFRNRLRVPVFRDEALDGDEEDLLRRYSFARPHGGGLEILRFLGRKVEVEQDVAEPAAASAAREEMLQSLDRLTCTEGSKGFSVQVHGSLRRDGRPWVERLG